MFEHPRNFREKLHTQKQITHFLLFMPSTSLEMHRNRFRSGLHWGSLQRSLRPLAGGEGARRVLPKNPTPSSALRASAIGYAVSSPTPPKINPSYGLEFRLQQKRQPENEQQKWALMCIHSQKRNSLVYDLNFDLRP